MSDSGVPRDRELMDEHPFISWREPLPVGVIGTGHPAGLGCRLCIARDGLRGYEVAGLPQTITEFAEHMRTFHGLEAVAP